MFLVCYGRELVFSVCSGGELCVFFMSFERESVFGAFWDIFFCVN